ncbi:MAG: hypothetical protein HYY52_01190 [Candidatus Melainabacteria bacterium]|nr:hypothetical protein [Candidatus Melainabacteria bacterium]
MQILILVLVLIFFPLKASSNPHDLEIFNNDKLARPEMKNMCSVCHINPSGGGPRNEFGEAFEAANETITNDLREKFPELFDLLRGMIPKIVRVKPSVFAIGKEIKVTILGKNFSADNFLHIDSVSIESTPHIEHEVIGTKKIVIENVTFNTPGKHTFHVVTPSGQTSNIFKVKAK